jgi:DsbC/DsbD-like thiol-disulfide interchange protein
MTLKEYTDGGGRSEQRSPDTFSPARTAVPLAAMGLWAASGATETAMIASKLLTIVVMSGSLASFAAGQPGQAGLMQPAEPDLRARPTVIAEHTALIAGETNLLAVHFEMDEKWHIYWSGQNDTGIPFEVEWSSPEGVTLGEIAWPAPQRYEAEGRILDHIYEDEITFTIPVEVSADVKPGSMVTITGESFWLVCADMCIPEQANLSITLPVVASSGEAGDSEHAATIRAARARLPEELDEGDGRVTTRWAGSRLVVTPAGAYAWAAFYPDADSVLIDDLWASGKAERGGLRLRPDRSIAQESEADFGDPRGPP